MYQLITQIITSIVIGYVYDLFGRRLTVALSFILVGIALILIPFCAPNIKALMATRVLLGIGLQM